MPYWKYENDVNEEALLEHWTSISALLFSVLMLSGCQIESEPKSDLDQIRERGVLRVGTLNNQLSYYIGLMAQQVWITNWPANSPMSLVCSWK